MRAFAMKLLYYAPHRVGGLADYAAEQAAALARYAELDVLGPDGRIRAPGEQVTDVPPRPAQSSRGATGAIRGKARGVRDLMRAYARLDAHARGGQYDGVLFASYAEYLAPLWAWRFRALRRRGVRFGAVVHDPVRDFQLGPAWWHRASIAAAYSFLDLAFVHEATALDTVRPFPDLDTVVIPHGPYAFPPAGRPRAAVRAALGLPPDAPVFLSFGHIRDGKNLDLVLRALVDLPEAYLVVAGKEQSSGQWPAGYYQRLAETLGVADRCRFLIKHIPEGEVGELFEAADTVLLTYSRAFRSASGVLNAAVAFRKPVVATSGAGPLRSAVEGYGLGVWGEPDSVEAILEGIRRVHASPPTPDWDRYEAESSWDRNARIVAEAFRKRIDSPPR